MVAGIRLREGGELAAGLPVKLAGVNNDAAQRGAVAADELGGGMDHDVRAVLDGADQVRRAESVVNDQRDAVLVGNFSDGVDVGDVGVGVAQRLQIDGAGVLLNGTLDLSQVVGIDEVVLTPKAGRVCSSRLEVPP